MSSYHILVHPLVVSVFMILALFLSGQIRHPFTSGILCSSQHHLSIFLAFFTTFYSYFIVVLFILNVFRAVNTAKGILDINFDSSLLFVILMYYARS